MSYEEEQFEIQETQDEFKHNFMIWVRDTRSRIGVNQKYISKAAGIDQAHVSRLENGLKNPSIETSIRLASVLGYKIVIVPID